VKFGRRFHPALMTALIISSIAGVVGPAGCGGSGGAAGGGRDGGALTVFAASSLTDAFGELEERFEKRNPGVEVRQSFESSSTLLTQIQQGAPADVFTSAAREEMRAAAQDGLVVGEPEIFARNRELIMVPKENPANIESMHDLSKPGIELVLAEGGVPAADYALKIVDEASAEYGSGFRHEVLSNVVSREADVRASVGRVALGDADATFGYASDYTPDIRDRVRVIRIPENLNRSAIYPIAVLEDAREPDLAREWVDLVVSSEGQRVLEKWGFRSAA
jgi:molybdate transport system substrate-binding protein